MNHRGYLRLGWPATHNSPGNAALVKARRNRYSRRRLRRWLRRIFREEG